ncbi:MAG: AAA family ATPase [Pirellulales bacterium]
MSGSVQSSTSTRVVDFMSRPESYGARVKAVERVETHISWVFLTDRHAYKLKKPVRFEFVDYSTIDARQRACLDELRLNRRLARDVYLSVVPITGDARGHLQLDGDGDPVDWVVKMRRLPDDCNLENMVRAGRLDVTAVHEVASLLATFFVTSAPVTIRPDDYRREIGEHVRANRIELMRDRSSSRLVSRVHAAQLRFLRLRDDLFDRRVRDGRIVDGHGDLRPQHIYIKGRPRVIDGVEFSAKLRQLDVADELAFLSMECERIGAAWVGDEVLRSYVRASGDRPPAELVDFYKSYRACVRAKVLRLRAKQLPTSERGQIDETIPAYLRLADRYARGLGTPLMIIVTGLSGSGKSTLAAQLAESLNMELLQTDAIRKELLEPMPARGPTGAPEGRCEAAMVPTTGPADRSAVGRIGGTEPTAQSRSVVGSAQHGSTAPAVEYGEGPYRASERRRVYEVMFDRARRALKEGLSVILDGAFLYDDLRGRAVDVARRQGAEPLLVHCECPPQVAQQRIAQRIADGQMLSDARSEFIPDQQEDEQPFTIDLPTIAIDTTTSLPVQIDEVIAHCGKLVASG